MAVDTSMPVTRASCGKRQRWTGADADLEDPLAGPVIGDADGFLAAG
jgi:hypothetical protein